MRATLTNSPAYQLAAELEPNALGFNLSFESFVPTARRPEVQRRFQAHLTEQELLQLRWLIDDVLTACGAKKLDRPASVDAQVDLWGKFPRHPEEQEKADSVASVHGTK